MDLQSLIENYDPGIVGNPQDWMTILPVDANAPRAAGEPQPQITPYAPALNRVKTLMDKLNQDNNAGKAGLAIAAAVVIWALWPDA